MIRAIGEQKEHHTNDDLPALGKTPLVVVIDNGDRRIGIFGAASDLGLVAFQDARRVEAEIVCIGAREAHGIGAARQGFEPVLFQGFEMVLADLQRLGNRRQIISPAKAAGPEFLTDRFQGRIRVAGNFAQMVAAAVLRTAFFDRQLGNFAH